jgi:hypothetical protein
MKEERFIAYLDILGFSDYVRKHSFLFVREKLKKFITKAVQTKNWNSSFGIISFSDTIILYAIPTGRDERLLHDLIDLSREIVIGMMGDGMFLRGVIHFGEFYTDPFSEINTEMYFGLALIEAHEAESSENIVGLFMLPAAACCLLKEGLPIVQLQVAFPKEYLVTYSERVILNLFFKISNMSCNEFLCDSAGEYQEEIQAYCRMKDELESKSENGPTKVTEKYENALRIAAHFLNYEQVNEVSRIEELDEIRSRGILD